MKKLIGYLLFGIGGFALGAVSGYMVRKKTTEAAFEEISEEEQAGQILKDAGLNPIDIQANIDTVFMSNQEKMEQLDTQKVSYFKKWKAEEAMSKYDTTTKNNPDTVVVTTDEDLEEGIDEELLNEMAEEADDQNRPDIEPASMEDWEHWSRMQGGDFDPDYDCVEVLWFRDGVLTDEDGRPLENPGKYIGFDIPKKFEEIDEETTGDPDVRIVYNHPKGAIYQITRKHCDYNRKLGMEEYGSDFGREGEYDDE